MQTLQKLKKGFLLMVLGMAVAAGAAGVAGCGHKGELKRPQSVAPDSTKGTN